MEALVPLSTPRAASKPNSGSAERKLRELLDRTSSTRKKQNLTNVWSALEHMRLLKVTEYTYAAVGRSIDALKLGGPRTSSIRNLEGADFRALIDAFAAEHGADRSSRADEEWGMLASIPDLVVRAHVRRIVAEKKSLTRRCNILHEWYSKLDPNVVQSAFELAKPTTSMLPQSLTSGLEFSEREVKAVRRLLEGLAESA